MGEGFWAFPIAPELTGDMGRICFRSLGCEARIDAMT